MPDSLARTDEHQKYPARSVRCGAFLACAVAALGWCGTGETGEARRVAVPVLVVGGPASTDMWETSSLTLT